MIFSNKEITQNHIHRKLTKMSESIIVCVLQFLEISVDEFTLESIDLIIQGLS